MSVGIGADRQRVWRALVRPDEMVAWNPGRVAALSVPADYPKPGQTARWRARLHGVTMPLLEKPLEVDPAERIRSELRFSLVRFDQTFAVTSDAEHPETTRVSLKLVAPNAIPMLGSTLDRFGVRELAQEMVDETLRSLRSWCEEDAAPPPPA